MQKPQLTKRSHGSIDMFFAQDQNAPSIDWELGLFVDVGLRHFLNNTQFNAIIDHYTKEKALSGTCVLIAHGGYDDKYRWTYSDSQNDFLMQNWIDGKDGKYGLIVLMSCNPANAEIRSRHSAVIAPNMDYSNGMVEKGQVQVELYLPKRGYMERHDIEEYIRVNDLKI